MRMALAKFPLSKRDSNRSSSSVPELVVAHAEMNSRDPPTVDLLNCKIVMISMKLINGYGEFNLQISKPYVIDGAHGVILKYDCPCILSNCLWF